MSRIGKKVMANGLRTSRACGLLLGLLAFFCAGGEANVFAQQTASIVGTKAPPFELTDVTGTPHSVSWPLPDNQILLLFFYEPRSAPSIQQMTWLDTMLRFSGHRGFTVLAVEASGLSTADTKSALDRFQNLYPAPSYPVCPDPDYTVSRLYRVQGIPATVIIGSDGVVLSSQSDFTRESKVSIATSIAGAIHRKLGLPATSLQGNTDPAPDAGNEVQTSATSPPPPAMAENVALGGRMPRINLVDLAGKSYELGVPLPEVRATVVFFWGAVCLPCILEMTYFNQLYRAYSDRGLRVFGIQASGLDANGTEGALKRYQRLYSRPVYPIVPDPDFALGRIFGAARGGPATFVADKQGTIVYADDKFLEGQEHKVTEAIAACLGVNAHAMKEKIRTVDTQKAGASESEAESVVVRMSEEKKESNLLWGNRYYGERKYDQALVYYLDYLKDAEQDIEIRTRVAQIYERRKEFNLALAQWVFILRIQPGNDMAIMRSQAIVQGSR